MRMRPITARALTLAIAGAILSTATAAADPPPIGDRLLKAQKERGQRLVNGKCAAACHTYRKGEAGRLGPNLWNIVGKPVAAKKNYRYSEAMRRHAAAGRVWTYDALDSYLAMPRRFLPGTSMTFVGLNKPMDRADVILYLRSLSDDPQPLPGSP